jgi:hypothetical protein
MELIVCSQPLTFDWGSIRRETSDVRSGRNAAAIESVNERSWCGDDEG